MSRLYLIMFYCYDIYYLHKNYSPIIVLIQFKHNFLHNRALYFNWKILLHFIIDKCFQSALCIIY